ncbi:hypothetical protein ACQJBY_036366 [Aegilops geniculata]
MNETVTGNDRWTGIYCLAVPHGGRDAATPCSVPMGLLCSMLPLVEFGMVSCYRLRRALGPSLLLIEPTSPVAGASSSRRSCCLPNLLLAASGCTISAVAASFDSSIYTTKGRSASLCTSGARTLAIVQDWLPGGIRCASSMVASRGCWWAAGGGCSWSIYLTTENELQNICRT